MANRIVVSEYSRIILEEFASQAFSMPSQLPDFRDLPPPPDPHDPPPSPPVREPTHYPTPVDPPTPPSPTDPPATAEPSDLVGSLSRP